MKTIIHRLLLATIALGAASVALAGPGLQHWQTLRDTEQFKKLKSGDKIAYVCNQCKTVSETTIESPTQAMEHCKEGSTVTCPSCKEKVKVSYKKGRNDPATPQREIVYTNEKGEECLFIAKEAASK